MQTERNQYDRNPPEEIMGIVIDDVTIRNALSNPESSRALKKFNTALWLRGCIAMESDCGASEISDGEILTRYRMYGNFMWDTEVSEGIANYLKSQGFLL